MNFDLLFRELARLAASPNGVLKIRELIFKLAFLGMLKTQDSNDEPADKLLERISNERGKGFSNTPKKEQLSHDFNLPNLPRTWVLATLGVVADVASGGTPSTKQQDYFDGKIPWITPADLSGYSKKYISRGKRNITEKGLRESSAALLPKGTVLFSSRAPIGYVAIAANPLSTNQGFKNFVPSRWVSSEYLYYYLKSAKTIAQRYASGTTFLEISAKKAATLPIPIAPLPEQRRIVTKIDKLTALCDELEAREREEKLGRIRLGTTVLTALQNATNAADLNRFWTIVSQQFDSLFNCQENVASLRATILQLAVQGKLVQQDPNDESAAVLTRRLKTEKNELKLLKSQAKNEEHLEILSGWTSGKGLPEGWAWVVLEQIATIMDVDHKMPQSVHSGVFFISPKDFVEPDGIAFERAKKISEEDFRRLSRKCKPQRGDIIYSRIGTIGKVRKAPADNRFQISYSLCLIRPNAALQVTDYLYWILKSPLVLDQALARKRSIGVPDLGLGLIRRFVIPIPPLSEQRRIVAKIEQLMALCDELEAKIGDKQKTSELLADAIVKGSLQSQDQEFFT